MKIIGKVLIFLCLLSVCIGEKTKPGSDKCKGKYEVYKTCGSLCPATCTQPAGSKLCSEVCVKGCFCADGYVKDSNENCIPIKDCKKCPRNENYSACGANICQPYCNRTLNFRCGKAICVSGCICNDGFIRAGKECITMEKCHGCGEHELYNPCGSSCPATCANPDPKQACNKLCAPGCFCKAGYLKNSDGKCVLQKDCKKCPEHEVFNNCGVRCEGTCENPETPICHALCTNVGICSCAKGFVRQGGKCIAPKKCPKPMACGKHEFWNICGSACGDLTCDNYNKPPPCTKQCVKGCSCVKDYVRNGNRQCVPTKECPKKP